MNRFPPLPLKPEYFSKALEAVGKKVIDASGPIMKEIAEAGAEYARAQYAKAEYDGEHDAIVRVEETNGVYSIVAYGESVKFIEYGTGVLSESKASKKRDFWVFSANGRKIRCTTPDGKRLDPTKRAYYTGPRKKRRHYINFEYQKANGQIVTGKKGEYRILGSGTGLRTTVDKNGNVKTKNIGIKSYKVNFVNAKRVDPRTENYLTYGNKANHCMTQFTVRYVTRVAAPEIFKKHFKTT